MNRCFDTVIDRKGTNSLKYDFAVERGKPGDLLPLWVADMDFKTAPPVLETMKNSINHGIFGYSESTSTYFEAVSHWYASYFDWKIQENWIVKTPGVVFAICMAIRAFTQAGDAVLIQRPVYYPFTESIESNGRVVVNNALVYADGEYQIDFEDFEDKIVQNRVKLFVLCSPHNPVGRVWTREELTKIGDICVRHNVLIVSDEIHSDIVYSGFKHHIFAGLKQEFLWNSITCTSPSKTFNLAGLQISNILIANPELRRKFQSEVIKSGYSQVNSMGIVACEAAYRYGRSWLEELKPYIATNLDLMRRFFTERLPQIRLIEPQGTYLIWTDWRNLDLDDTQLEELIVHRAKLWLDRGTLFGPEGAGFERFNIACPSAVLQEALFRIEQAVRGNIHNR